MSTQPDGSATGDGRSGVGGRLLRRVAIGLGVVAATLGFAGLTAAGIAGLHLRAAAEPERAVLPPVTVATTRVRIDDGYVRSATFTGRLEAARETALAFERAGLVVAVAREEASHARGGRHDVPLAVGRPSRPTRRA